jgi:hypothetical protein
MYANLFEKIYKVPAWGPLTEGSFVIADVRHTTLLISPDELQYSELYIYIYIYLFIYLFIFIYRVSQEERTRLRESVA